MMDNPIHAYDPKTGQYQGSFFGVDPTLRGFVVTEQAGWWGAVWDPSLKAYREDLLTTERESMICARWQMIMALGPERWGAITAFAARPDAPWGIKVVIENAVDIIRLSETIDTLAWLLGFDDAQVDDLFRQAMSLRA